jgi:cation:H+ antiporter
MLIDLISLIIGLALLWSGAELLIRFSAVLARSMGVSPIIIGLTIVSLGTSLPEFVVSLIAALQNTMGISIGNIIGSNIANLGLILGIGALISLLNVQKNWVYREVPFMLFATFIFMSFARSHFLISRIEGFILLLILALYLGYLSRTTLSQMKTFEENSFNGAQISLKKKSLYLLLSMVGIALLIGSSKIIVNSGIAIASYLGVSDTVIGLTLIAVGTSLPELATTIVGLIKKETDIVVGNIIGSNIFNLLFIGGTVSLIRPIEISPYLFDREFLFLLGISVLIWPIMRIRWNIQKLEGLILLIIYILFIIKTFQTV